ncbi:hypothetical protein T4E_9746 [Trichinella pseudospiralis]|uniref:Uncharacterized protein n=1 Tax=Trichinella pseudospiralis TaxID=6337 RepID=A0A0V0YBZ5_TRIPS|nr:hypothetical protein T4E_9746 [Trichinella pseudospiralis]
MLNKMKDWLKILYSRVSCETARLGTHALAQQRPQTSASPRHLLQLLVQLLSEVINEADALGRNCQTTSNASVKLNGLGGASLSIWRL